MFDMDDIKSSGLKWLTDLRNKFVEISPDSVLRFEGTDTVALRTARSHEFLLKLFTSVAGIVATIGFTYIGVRWLVDAMDPTVEEKRQSKKKAAELMKNLGLNGVKLTDYELCIASNLIDPVSVDTHWEDIGGLPETITEIQETIIMPLCHHSLFSESALVQPPKGVLLYGPPGCGKTLIARATAKAAGARFINLQVSTLVDKWYGESQKRAEAVFSLAKKLQPVIIFIDEIDSFLRSRASADHEATAMMKTQFMSFWDGLLTDNNSRIVIMGATNRPADIDAAILRRMPTRFHIGLPNADQRLHILSIILRTEDVSDDVDLSALAEHTEGYSGSDLRELCRTAAVGRVREYINSDQLDNGAELRPITSSDFRLALEKTNLTKHAGSTLPRNILLD